MYLYPERNWADYGAVREGLAGYGFELILLPPTRPLNPCRHERVI